MGEESKETIDQELASWNDRMYAAHATPYDGGMAGRIQNARVATVMRYCGIGKQDAVLEVGCEAGRLLIEAPPCRRLVGADISGHALADAQALFDERGREAEFYQLDAQRALPFDIGEFDVIICSEMLEHVSEPRKVIQNLHAITDRNTRTVLTVPIEAPKVMLKRVLRRIGLLGLLFPGIEPEQSQWHLQAFSRRMLLRLTDDLFELENGKTVWGCHYVARLAKKQ